MNIVSLDTEVNYKIRKGLSVGKYIAITVTPCFKNYNNQGILIFNLDRDNLLELLNEFDNTDF